jgi:uncharacterized protein (DUF1015 family)
MKLKVGDVVAWRSKESHAIRTGQYIGKHAYRLKQEKKSADGVDDNLVRIWPTKIAASARKLTAQAKKGSIIFVVMHTDDLVLVPKP